MTPFDRSHTSSYSPSIVTMALYLVSFARYSDLLVKNRVIFIPHLYLAFSAPVGGDPVGIPYGEKMLPKSLTVCVGCMNVTRSQTTDIIAVPLAPEHNVVTFG